MMARRYRAPCVLAAAVSLGACNPPVAAVCSTAHSSNSDVSYKNTLAALKARRAPAAAVVPVLGARADACVRGKAVEFARANADARQEADAAVAACAAYIAAFDLASTPPSGGQPPAPVPAAAEFGQRALVTVMEARAADCPQPDY
jgi:hypothetical protein